jgi:hypothetical protein
MMKLDPPARTDQTALGKDIHWRPRSTGDEAILFYYTIVIKLKINFDVV